MQVFKEIVTILDILFVLFMCDCQRKEADRTAKTGFTVIVVLIMTSILAIWL